MAEVTTNRIGFHKDGNWYLLNSINMLPTDIFNLTSASTSSQISNAIGGESGFEEIYNLITEGNTSLVGKPQSSVLTTMLDSIAWKVTSNKYIMFTYLQSVIYMGNWTATPKPTFKQLCIKNTNGSFSVYLRNIAMS